MEHHQAYCDESGKHDQSRIFIMSGMVAQRSTWDALSIAWSKVLAEQGISCFHATDCEHGYKEFKGLSLQDRERVQDRLIRVIVKSKVHCVATVIRKEDYETIRHRLRTVDKYRPIYLLGFEAAVVEMLHATVIGDVAFIFDRQKEYQGRAKELYDALTRYPAFVNRARLGPLIFESKEKAIPLQASDLFAYEAYQYATDKSGRRMRWQLRLLNTMKPQPRLVRLTRRILERLAEVTEQRRQAD